MFGKTMLDWFRQYFPYRKRSPSADTLIRFFSKSNPEVFGTSFINWASQKFKNLDNEVGIIDAKTLRGSFDAFAQQAAIHMVSAYANNNQLTLGQVITPKKKATKAPLSRSY